MKTKHLLFLVMCLLQGASAFAATTFTSTTVEGVEVTYTIIEGVEPWVEVKGTYKTSSYNPAISTATKGHVTIPETVYYIDHSYTVVRIGKYAFNGCREITSVSIPSHVSTIDTYAFRNCSSLESTGLYNNVTTVGSYAYSGCTSLTGELIIPNSVTTIGSNAFDGCTGITSVSMPSSLESLPNRIFANCSGLTSVTVPTSVTSIGNGAFEKCTNLTTVNLPNTITSIGSSAFSYCRSLKSIVLPTKITKIDTGTFSQCSALESIVIPYGVTSISGFQNCSSLESITIPSTVTNFAINAFDECSALKKVIVEAPAAWCNITFGESNSSPLYYAKHMYDMQGNEITNFTIPNGITSINSKAFWGWEGLLEVSIPGTVTSIGSSAFNGCKGLTSVSIPNSVETVGSYAFAGCSGLESVSIPNGEGNLTSLSSYMFKGCSRLESFDIPNGYTSIGARTFEGCSRLTSVSIPSTLINIGECAFQYCSKLTTVKVADIVAWCNTSINALSSSNPVTVCKHIHDQNGNEITDLVIPEGVSTIKSAAFYGCQGLKSVVMPCTLTSLNSNAFMNCTNLETVYSWMETPPELKSGMFGRSGITSNQYTNSRLVLLAGTVEDYAEKGWTSSYFRGGVYGDRATIGSAGVATYCSPRPLDFSTLDNVKAYIVSAFTPSTGMVTLTRVTDVPANTGLVLLGEADTHYIPVGTGLSITSNMLQGVTEPTVLSKEDEYNMNFILANVDGEIGFYSVTDGSTLAAGKAYLPLSKVYKTIMPVYNNAPLRFVIEEGIGTGIEEMESTPTSKNDGIYYNLKGQRVDNPSQGIYIVNGKKVFIK